MIKLDEARRIAEAGDPSDVVPIERSWILQAIAEIEDGRMAAEALGRCGDVFGLQGVKL